MNIPKKDIINKKNNFICSLYQVENFLNKFTILFLLNLLKNKINSLLLRIPFQN